MRQFKMRLDSQLIFLEWTNIMNIMLPEQELNFYLKLPSNISGTYEFTKQNFESLVYFRKGWIFSIA